MQRFPISFKFLPGTGSKIQFCFTKTISDLIQNFFLFSQARRELGLRVLTREILIFFSNIVKKPETWLGGDSTERNMCLFLILAGVEEGKTKDSRPSKSDTINIWLCACIIWLKDEFESVNVWKWMYCTLYNTYTLCIQEYYKKTTCSVLFFLCREGFLLLPCNN